MDKKTLLYENMMQTIAKDIMSSKLIVAKDDMSIESAVRLLVQNKVTGLPVVDSKGRMVGILSEYDIIASVGKKLADPAILNDGITYSKKVECVSEDTLLEDILHKFIELKCRRLPVLDSDERLVGIISRRDVMKVLYYRAKVAG